MISGREKRRPNVRFCSCGESSARGHRTHAGWGFSGVSEQAAENRHLTAGTCRRRHCARSPVSWAPAPPAQVARGRSGAMETLVFEARCWLPVGLALGTLACLSVLRTDGGRGAGLESNQNTAPSPATAALTLGRILASNPVILLTGRGGGGGGGAGVWGVGRMKGDAGSGGAGSSHGGPGVGGSPSLRKGQRPRAVRSSLPPGPCPDRELNHDLPVHKPRPGCASF